MKKSNGFTLIELLVVISIIALLISVLLPALKRAREGAQQVQCLSKQRQIIVGVNAYADTYDGYLPPARANRDANYWQLSFQYQVSLLMNIEDVKNPLFTCPSDDDLPARAVDQYHAYASYKAYSSYGGNASALIYLSPTNNYKMFRRSQSRFPDKWVQISGAENLWFSAVGTAEWYDAVDNYDPASGIASFHDRGTNVGILDGHAEYMAFPHTAGKNDPQSWIFSGNTADRFVFPTITP